MNDSKELSIGGLVFEMLGAMADAKIETRLRKLGEDYSYAEDIFEYLSYNEKSYLAHSVERVARGTGVDYYNSVKIFKVLDEMGMGSFVVGRKGHDTRFLWKFDSRSVGKVGIGKSYNILPINKNTYDYDGLKPSEQIKKHEFYLREDYLLSIDLPSDFNQRDFARLSKWLATIPFD